MPKTLYTGAHQHPSAGTNWNPLTWMSPGGTEMNAGHAMKSPIFYSPVQRIPQYDKYLSDLLAETEEAHPDFEDLSKAATKVKNMVKERQQEMNYVENDYKVESVQDRFPNDDLRLQEKDNSNKLRNLHTRRRSAPSAMLLRTLSGKSRNSTSPAAISGLDLRDTYVPDASDRVSNNVNRIYVLEGPVQLISGLQTQDRYLFLFNDLLLIAKQKSSTTFKLKHRIRVCEMWTATCIGDVCETTKPSSEKSFVMGWPTTNVVATFNSTNMKELWAKKLNEQIALERGKEQPKTVTLKVINKDMDSYAYSKSFPITNTDTASECTKQCLEQFHITEGEPSDYQLWVLSGKEGSPYPLIGHEHPYAIKMSHVRDASKATGDDFILPIDVDPSAENVDPQYQCQFFLRNTTKAHNKLSLEEGNGKRKKLKKSPLISFFKRSHTKSEHDQEDVSPTSPTAGKLFGHPLGDICVETELPKSIMELLTQLFHNAPFTTGIFRKSANFRVCKQLKTKLDHGEEVVLEEFPPLVIGAVTKEFFRTMPDCLLSSEMYDQWIDTLDIQETKERINKIRKTMEKLPKCNQMLLKHFMCILWHVHKRQEENSMNAYNLSVCVAQSLLWPSLSAGPTIQTQAAKRVPQFVQFMVEYCPEVFGEDSLRLFGDLASPKTRQDSSTDSDSMHSVLSNPDTGIQRDDSSMDSLEREIYTGDMDSSPQMVKSHLSPSNLSRDSGLTLSDTQLYDDGNEKEGNSERKLSHSRSSDKSGRYEHVKLSRSYTSGSVVPPVPPPRRNRRRSDDPPMFDSMQRRYPQSLLPPPLLENNGRSTSMTPNMTNEMLKHMRDQYYAKNISSDSLGSGEENSETDCVDDFDEILKRFDIGTIRKSESGAKLYYNEQLIHTRDDDDMHSPAIRQQSNDSAVVVSPPLTPNTATSISSVDSDTMRFRCPKPRAPTPDEEIMQSEHVSSEQRQKPWMARGSDINALLDNGNHSTPPSMTSVNLRVDGNYGHPAAYALVRSASSPLKEGTPKFMITPPTSPAHSSGNSVTPMPATNTPNSLYRRQHFSHSPRGSLSSKGSSMDSDYSSPRNSAGMDIQVPSLADEEVPPPRPPKPAAFMSPTAEESLPSDHTLVSSPPPRVLLKQQFSKSGARLARVAMTPKGDDYFPGRGKLIQGAVKNANLNRSPKAAQPSYNNNKENITRSDSYRHEKPVGLERLKQYSLEKSASDSRLGKHFPTKDDSAVVVMRRQKSNESAYCTLDRKRPARPPTYHEAMQRKELIRRDAVDEENFITDQDRITQTVNSARARQLYEDSMKKYAKEQGVPLKDVVHPTTKLQDRAELAKLRRIADHKFDQSLKLQTDSSQNTPRPANLQRSHSDSHEHLNKISRAREMHSIENSMETKNGKQGAAVERLRVEHAVNLERSSSDSSHLKSTKDKYRQQRRPEQSQVFYQPEETPKRNCTPERESTKQEHCKRGAPPVDITDQISAVRETTGTTSSQKNIHWSVAQLRNLYKESGKKGPSNPAPFYSPENEPPSVVKSAHPQEGVSPSGYRVPSSRRSPERVAGKTHYQEPINGLRASPERRSKTAASSRFEQAQFAEESYV